MKCEIFIGGSVGPHKEVEPLRPCEMPGKLYLIEARDSRVSCKLYLCPTHVAKQINANRKVTLLEQAKTDEPKRL